MNRGRKPTQNWSAQNLFFEKQNDTADIIVVENEFFNLIDVKTHSGEKQGQPPNIVSAPKLAKMTSLMLDSDTFHSHDFTYVGVTWIEYDEALECTKASIKELFKACPSSLYINWAAAMQIQFHVDKIDQSFDGSVECWCREYLRHFVSKAEERTQKMRNQYVTPYKKYLE